MKRLPAKKIGLNLTVTPETKATIRELAKASGKTLSDTVASLAMQGFAIPLTASKENKANLKELNQQVEMLDNKNADLRRERDEGIKKGEAALLAVEKERDEAQKLVAGYRANGAQIVEPVAQQITKRFLNESVDDLAKAFGMEKKWIEHCIRVVQNPALIVSLPES